MDETKDIMVENLQKSFEDKIKYLEEQQKKLEELYKLQNIELNKKMDELMGKQKVLEQQNKEFEEKMDILMELNPGLVYVDDPWLKDNIFLINKACHNEGYFDNLLYKMEDEDKVDLYEQVRNIWHNDNDYDVYVKDGKFKGKFKCEKYDW